MTEKKLRTETFRGGRWLPDEPRPAASARAKKRAAAATGAADERLPAVEGELLPAVRAFAEEEAG